MTDFKSKNVLVTGASTGIGKAIAIQFAKLGANVTVNYYSQPDKAESTKQQMLEACQEMEKCGAKPLLVQGDVSQPEDVENLVTKTVEQFGSLDILVNNAGIQVEGPSHELAIEDFDRMLAINLRGAFLCSQLAIKHFLERGIKGVIINNSSVHEVIPRPGYVGYAVSKGGMENMTRTLALEYARKGIRVNAIGPGATATPINEWVNDPKQLSKAEEFIPMGRVGEPEEMAMAVTFLASEKAAYITGQTLFIDGGLTLYPGFRESIT